MKIKNLYKISETDQLYIISTQVSYEFPFIKMQRALIKNLLFPYAAVHSYRIGNIKLFRIVVPFCAG